MAPAIRTKELTKFYGDTLGVARLDLEVARGEVFGFIGPNGSGKSTTMRLLMDVIRPSDGSATVLDLDCQRDAVDVHRITGYLPGELHLPGAVRARSFLRAAARVRRGVAEHDIEALADRLGLDLDRPMRDLSKGNKQKVGLVQAFMHAPELLILDEPTSGLDPIGQRIFNDMVREARAEGRTVFLSSHVLSEVERTADRVGMVRDGKLVKLDQVNAVKAEAVRRFEVHFAQEVPSSAFANVAGLVKVEMRGRAGTFTVQGSLGPLLRALGEHTVEDLIRFDTELEDVFLAQVEGGDQGGA